MKINKKVICSIVAVNILLSMIGYFANKTVIQNELNSNIKITTEEKSKSFVMKLTIYQLIISLITLGLSLLVLSFILKKYLSVPLNKLVDFFKELSNGQGDLTKTMNITTNDEISEVMSEFNKFILKLRLIISQVKESSHIVKEETIGLSNRVSSCTDSMIEISEFVSKISDNMMGNSVALEEITASAHEMNKSSNMVAQSCLVVSEKSIFANEITEEGSKAIKDIITSIQNISSSSGDVIVKMNELQNLSDKINDIVTIITNISRETNLLSINASIEAARAGEHGSGFGVVAEEIRKLAEESSKSSNEIINLIHEVQCNIKDTSLKVDTVSENIDFSVNESMIVDKRFKYISDAINIVSEKTHDIAAAAEEQAASVEQISSAMDEIASVTERTAEDSYKMNVSVKQERESMEEANVVTQRVTKIIRDMNLIVEKFKTR